MPTCVGCQTENPDGATACSQCGQPLGAPPTRFVIALDLRPGTLFHSRYEIGAGLGRGGMGVVYQARDRTLDETVAIKILRPDFANDPRMTERFKSEIKLARRVRHRNVCAIHDFGEDQGLLYISMELVEGEDLKRILRAHQGLPEEQAYDLAIQVAEGLKAVHDAGIVHRDLKTPNIMLDAAGVARLMDFGVAKRVGEGTITATGHILGTPEYMSPEQAQGRKVDARSDLYALGVVIWEIFTGNVPFRGDTPISTIMKHLHDPPPLEGPEGRRLPPALRPVLARALEKDAADRYQSAQEMADALREARRAPPGSGLEFTCANARPDPGGARPYAIPPDVAPTEHMEGSPPPARSMLQPWLLAVPLVVVGAGVLFVRQRTQAPDVQTAQIAPPSTVVLATAPPTLAPDTSAAPPASLSQPPATPAPARTGVVASARATPAARVPTPGVRLAAAPSPSLAPVTMTMPASPAAAPPSAPGLLQVAVVPWGTVFVDGREVGDTPLDRIPLPPGSHTVRIRHPGFEVLERQVTIVSGQTEKIVVNLPREARRKP